MKSQSSYVNTLAFLFLFSTAIKERKGKSNTGNSCAPAQGLMYSLCQDLTLKELEKRS